MIWILLACADKPRPFMDLVDVYEPTLTVNYSERLNETPKLQVLLNSSRAGVCRPLPDLKATIDGVELTRLHGHFEDTNFHYDRDCSVYEFEADAALLGKRPAAPDAKVSLSDGKTSYAVTVKNMFVPRTLRVEGALEAGKEVVLRVDPKGDIVNKEPVFALMFLAGDVKEKVEAKWIDGGIHAVVPEGVHGETTIEWYGSGFFQPAMDGCTSHACTASRTVLGAPLVVSVK